VLLFVQINVVTVTKHSTVNGMFDGASSYGTALSIVLAGLLLHQGYIENLLAM